MMQLQQLLPTKSDPGAKNLPAYRAGPPMLRDYLNSAYVRTHGGSGRAMLERGTPEQVFAPTSVPIGQLDSATSVETRDLIQRIGGSNPNVTSYPILGRNATDQFGNLQLYKVRGVGGQPDQLVDGSGRSYTNLPDYLHHNQLQPDSTMVMADPDTPLGQSTKVIQTPAHINTDWQNVKKYAGPPISVAGMAGATALAIGTEGAATPLAVGVVSTAIGYSSAESIDHFVDRGQHGQSNNILTNPDARDDALVLAGNALGAGAPLARGVRGASRLMNAGAVGAFGGITYDEGHALVQNWDHLNTDQRTQALGQLGLNTAMLGLPAKNMATGRDTTPARPTTEEARRAGTTQSPVVESPAIKGGDAQPRVEPKSNSSFATQRDQAVATVSQQIGRPNDPETARGLGRAYDVAVEHSAPFVTKIAHDMLPDLRADVERDPSRVITFVGRDGHSLARATRELDPQFFAQHCTECTLSRATVESAVQDYSRQVGDPLPGLDKFRGAANKVNPDDVDGSWSRLTDYLEDSGIPVQDESPGVTLVDTSYKGTVQVLLSGIYPHVRFQGRYAFFAESPHDPLPGTKQGYELHLTGGEANSGLPHEELLPDDPALTFSNKDAIGTIEETLHGPLNSPNGIGEQGPRQSLQRFESDSLTGLNPAKVDNAYIDPTVREGVKRINLQAVTDYARHIAALHNQGKDVGPLLRAGADSYIDNVRRWVAQNNVDPTFGPITDSFVRRADKGQVKELVSTLDKAGLTSDRTQAIWEQFDQLRTLDDKQRFVNEIRHQHPG